MDRFQNVDLSGLSVYPRFSRSRAPAWGRRPEVFFTAKEQVEMGIEALAGFSIPAKASMPGATPTR